MYSQHNNLSNANPDDFIAFTSPNTSFKTPLYILKTSLEAIKKNSIPKKDDHSLGGDAYYSNDTGRYAGSACTSYFLKSKEIQKYMMEDSEFITRAIKENITWFLPKEAKEIFIF